MTSVYYTPWSTSGRGYAGLSFDYNGNTHIYGYNGDTTGGATVAPAEKLTVLASGNVGLGTTNPRLKLDLVDPSSGFQMRFSSGSNEGGLGADPNGFFRVVGTVGGAFGTGSISQGTFSEVMRINGSNVGIGTMNPLYPLSVNGVVQAKEVLVNTGWSDYVFDPSYRLPSLAEVAAYIQTNHHLPEIPSEAEVKEKGVSLGEMQSKLLAKVEELTLHMIEAADRNDRLERENRELHEAIDEIRASLRTAKSVAGKN